MNARVQVRQEFEQRQNRLFEKNPFGLFASLLLKIFG
jgi:hypothetical protein